MYFCGFRAGLLLRLSALLLVDQCQIDICGTRPYLYGGVCVVFVGSIQRELDLEDLGGTQQQFLSFFCAPGAEWILAVTAPTAAGSSTTITTPRPAAAAAAALPRTQRFHLGFTRLLVGPLTVTLALALILVLVGGVGVLFGRVPLHIHRFVLPG